MRGSMGKTVYVGMSGGVDSSVSALLLKEQGYNVVGVYMKNWSRDLPGMKCPWAEDLADAKRVAVKLGIDFKVFDFEKEYHDKVVDYMLAEFKAGRTPNPDIMCNQEIKFKLFYEVSMEQGADFIATGHYAGVKDGKLLRAADENKDQTYFLYRISEEALSHTLFPIGDMLKPDVKKLAAEKGLHNAYRKESMGVCFVGDVGMDDFLKEYFPVTPGDIIDAETGEKLGVHEGAVFYTIGQRHGLNIGGGLPYYVVSKDMNKNIVFVSKNLNNKEIWTRELKLKDVVLRTNISELGVFRSAAARSPLGTCERSEDLAPAARGDGPAGRDPELEVLVRLRHRAPLIPAVFDGEILRFENEIKRPASGQSAVLYDGEICLGGGIIA
ncbi:tRNA 2-thiouridine(34) synthase MnmA [Candidatus Saccharibacteria bacterium]|nr:tRNA 2-thiouridine(34) synthase MnmA [Candidatus Saccharibacteria bacterium]